MAKNIIFYFTGSGNSLAAAKKIARQLGDCEVVFMKDEFTPAAHYERMGFVMPCYAAGAPKAALQFLKELPLTGDSADYFFSVITCNEAGGNAPFMINKVLSKKGLRLNYAKTVRMVGNYVILYPIPDNTDELLRRADVQLDGVATEIQQKAETEPPRSYLPFTMFYGIGNQFFRVKERQMHVSSACTGCGLCAQMCPVGNIAMKDGKSQFLHKNCAQCMACLHWCPCAAIDCGKQTAQRGRYHHPDVKAVDLLESMRG